MFDLMHTMICEINYIISDYSCSMPSDLIGSDLGYTCMGEYVEPMEGDKINCSRSCSARANELLTGGCCYYDYITNECNFYRNGRRVEDVDYGFYASLCTNGTIRYNSYYLMF